MPTPLCVSLTCVVLLARPGSHLRSHHGAPHSLGSWLSQCPGGLSAQRCRAAGSCSGRPSVTRGGNPRRKASASLTLKGSFNDHGVILRPSPGQQDPSSPQLLSPAVIFSTTHSGGCPCLPACVSNYPCVLGSGSAFKKTPPRQVHPKGRGLRNSKRTAGRRGLHRAWELVLGQLGRPFPVTWESPRNTAQGRPHLPSPHQA